MTVAIIDHIVLDEHGLAYVKGSRIKVLHLVTTQKANNWTPEELQQQYPHLSLSQIYAALSYYYDHQSQIDSEIKERFQRAWQKQPPIGNAAIERLKAAVRANPSVRFYLDESVEAPIAKGLRACGFDVLTAKEDGFHLCNPQEILARATYLGRVVFTREDEFLNVARQLQVEGSKFSGLVHADMSYTTPEACIHQAYMIAQIFDADEIKNNIKLIPLS